jgi:CRP/FNR family transcriptional regulator, anaerobic regulatory protein
MVNLDFDLNKEYLNFNEEIRSEIASCFRLLHYKKNELVLEAGEVCKGIYYIESGCCRSFLISNNKEITTTFSLEKSIICSAKSYLLQIPSIESIQAIEDTVCYYLSYYNIQILLNKHFEFNNYVRKLYEVIYIEAENMLNSIRTDSALQRYEQFMEETPHLLQRIPLGYLASYLGMSRETLSRMRGLVC